MYFIIIGSSVEDILYMEVVIIYFLGHCWTLF